MQSKMQLFTAPSAGRLMLIVPLSDCATTVSIACTAVAVTAGAAAAATSKAAAVAGVTVIAAVVITGAAASLCIARIKRLAAVCCSRYTSTAPVAVAVAAV
eukprot:14875-Heterococcus_DN1.PRE.1